MNIHIYSSHENATEIKKYLFWNDRSAVDDNMKQKCASLGAVCWTSTSSQYRFDIIHKYVLKIHSTITKCKEKISWYTNNFKIFMSFFKTFIFNCFRAHIEHDGFVLNCSTLYKRFKKTIKVLNVFFLNSYKMEHLTICSIAGVSVLKPFSRPQSPSTNRLGDWCPSSKNKDLWWSFHVV